MNERRKGEVREVTRANTGKGGDPPGPLIYFGSRRSTSRYKSIGYSMLNFQCSVHRHSAGQLLQPSCQRPVFTHHLLPFVTDFLPAQLGQNHAKVAPKAP